MASCPRMRIQVVLNRGGASPRPCSGNRGCPCIRWHDFAAPVYRTVRFEQTGAREHATDEDRRPIHHKQRESLIVDHLKFVAQVLGLSAAGLVEADVAVEAAGVVVERHDPQDEPLIADGPHAGFDQGASDAPPMP